MSPARVWPRWVVSGLEETAGSAAGWATFLAEPPWSNSATAPTAPAAAATMVAAPMASTRRLRVVVPPGAAEAAGWDPSCSGWAARSAPARRRASGSASLSARQSPLQTCLGDMENKMPEKPLGRPCVPLKVGKCPRRRMRQDACPMSRDVVTLRAGDLEARFVPSVGMVGASLRLAGRELLGLRSGLDAYRARGATFGIPLLHPWANRLGGFAYTVDGVSVGLDAANPRLHTEEHGLPIHRLLAAHPGSSVLERGETEVVAELDFGADPDLIGAFPFEHRLRLGAQLDAGTLTIATTLIPTGDRAVPVAFGFHPYFALPDTAREELELAHGAMTHLTLDDRGLPDGGREPVDARDGRLGDATYDDLFTDLGDEPAVTLRGAGRALTVTFLEGYTHLQLFAPPGTTSVAIEPMTAPTDALRTGDGLRRAEPGEEFTARFAIAVRDQA